MYCTKCGNKLNENTATCPNCDTTNNNCVFYKDDNVIMKSYIGIENNKKIEQRNIAVQNKKCFVIALFSPLAIVCSVIVIKLLSNLSNKLMADGIVENLINLDLISLISFLSKYFIIFAFFAVFSLKYDNCFKIATFSSVIFPLIATEIVSYIWHSNMINIMIQTATNTSILDIYKVTIIIKCFVIAIITLLSYVICYLFLKKLDREINTVRKVGMYKK